MRLKPILQYSHIPTKRILWLGFSALLFALCLPAQAQQASKIYRIGFLLAACGAESPRTLAFREGLRQLGYVEGKNIVIEWRKAEGKLDRLTDLAAEIV